MKEIKDSNKSQNEQNKNEIKEEEHIEVFNDQKKWKEFHFWKLWFTKECCLLKNNDYYKKLKGKNIYEKDFFIIQYLFKPNLKAFSDTKLAINFESSNNFLEKVFEDFQSKARLEPLDSIQKLKWISWNSFILYLYEQLNKKLF